MVGRTTIQLDLETQKMLERMKKELGVRSYAEVIRELLKTAKSLPRTEKGLLRGLRAFVREEIDRFD